MMKNRKEIASSLVSIQSRGCETWDQTRILNFALLFGEVSFTVILSTSLALLYYCQYHTIVLYETKTDDAALVTVHSQKLSLHAFLVAPPTTRRRRTWLLSTDLASLLLPRVQPQPYLDRCLGLVFLSFWCVVEDFFLENRVSSAPFGIGGGTCRKRSVKNPPKLNLFFITLEGRFGYKSELHCSRLSYTATVPVCYDSWKKI